MRRESNTVLCRASTRVLQLFVSILLVSDIDFRENNTESRRDTLTGRWHIAQARRRA